jgi:hypothetical protein
VVPSLAVGVCSPFASNSGVLLKSLLDSIIASGCHEIEMRVAASFRAPTAPKSRKCVGRPIRHGKVTT